MAQYGLVGGNKATSMQWPDIPKELLPHFVRGLWDSDGAWARNGRRADYACSSLQFVQSLCGVLVSLGMEPRLETHETELNGKKFVGYRLRLLVRHTLELAKWLYDNSAPSTRCARKFEFAFQGGSGPWV